MQGGGEGRRFETLHIVAGRALSGIRAPGELPPVRVIPVAVGTAAMRDWDFEVAGPVTGLAGQALMLASEGIIRGPMIECCRDLRRLPAGGGVASLARLTKRILVRIAVAGRAVGKHDIPESCVWPAVLDLRMAFPAVDFGMRAGQHKLRPIMIVLGRILPSG